MTEYEDDEFDDDDILSGDDDIMGGYEESDWAENDPFFDNIADIDQSFTWEDNLGFLHELYTGELPEESELRAHFDTPEEAELYIDKILTDVDQFFEIVPVDDGYEVYYMGKSE